MILCCGIKPQFTLHFCALQLFIDGEHVGDGSTIMELNEAGDLEELVKEFMVK